VVESKDEYPSEFEAIRSIARKLGIGSTETLRKWVRQAEIDGGVKAGETSQEIAEIRELNKEVAELRRANPILKSASAFLRGGARPSTQVLVDFVDEHRQVDGVEPICRVLSEHGVKIAASTCYEVRHRLPSRRAVREAEILALIAKAPEHKFRARFGARKMWLHLRTSGHDVARCTVERLMTQQGWVGALRGKKVRTAIPAASDPRPADLVDRDFTAARPNQLWVGADFTFVGPGQARSTWRSSSTSSPA